MLILVAPPAPETDRTRAPARPSPAVRQPRPSPPPSPPPPRTGPGGGREAMVVAAVFAVVVAALGTQMLRLGYRAEPAEGARSLSLTLTPPPTQARPDILDRRGRLLATDVEVYSFYADPARVLNADELVEKLATVVPDIETVELRRNLADRQRRFLWLRRGLSPRVAAAVHSLGLPGVGYRREYRRVYPSGALAGHVLGQVNSSNRGVSGIERHIDEALSSQPAPLVQSARRPPVRLSIDVAVQAALEAELADTAHRLSARATAAVIMDVETGEIVAAGSTPRVDPARAYDPSDTAGRDRLHADTYELGSIFKVVTVAMALDSGRVRPDTRLDVRRPIDVGRRKIEDLHPSDRPLSVAEVFLHSSNVGAGLLALDLGAEEQSLFLARAGLVSGLRTELGPVAPPQLPRRWGRAATVTVSYGHGLAVAPLQFAATASALVNGGLAVQPTYLARTTRTPADGDRVRVIEPATSAAIRDLMRRNVAETAGTGRRADVAGYEVGGKTGTADIPGPRGYRTGGVISSFLAAFPMSAPRYVMLVTVFEPKPSRETGGKVLAGVTAAPAAGRIIARVGPLLGR